jgi:hypothetical protein
MSAVTAIFLLGTTHPNEQSLNPSALLKLHEGDRAMWSAHLLNDSEFEMVSSPNAPEIILEAGCRLAQHINEVQPFDSVAVVSFEGSSINPRLQEVKKFLKDKNVILLTSN